MLKNFLIVACHLASLFLLINEQASVACQPQTLKNNEFFPGDALSISFIDIYKQIEKKSIDISGEYQIDSRGYIMMPIVGPLKVIGYNRYTLVDKIKEEYKAYFSDPFIVISPLIRVTVMGAFGRPGSYRISPESSLWQLLDEAGGPRENCDLSSLCVIRNKKVVIKNLLASFEKGYSLADIGVESGDQITAKTKRQFNVRTVVDYMSFGLQIVYLFLWYQQYN